MPEMRITKPFMGTFITYIFMFSTMYTLLYFWFLGSGGSMGVQALTTSDKTPDMLSTAFLLIDWILEFISWLSPFVLVKGIVWYILQPLDPNFYMLLDLLFLRPASWIMSLVIIEFALKHVPTVGGE
jgi:hypothetical protein